MKARFGITCALLCLRPLLVDGQSPSAQANPYAPSYTDCPNDLQLRNASEGLSGNEKSWRRERAREIKVSLETYLKNANVTGLDIKKYIDKLDSENVPVVGMAISGGGTQSGIGGFGVWQAFDARYPRAIEAGTGGLIQILTYLTGLSGGGALTVSLLATNNFSSVEDIVKSTNFSSPYDNPSPKDIEKMFENTGAKLQAGLPISVTDVFGQFWATWVPEDWRHASFSAIANNNTAFKSGRAPMPILTLAEVIPGVSPEVHKIAYPGRNTTNGFNLTSYEVNPFEFGSWFGGRVQAFMPTRYLGTAMTGGKTQNKSACVEGFDKISFIQGSTADAFCAWFIDDFYNIPVFTKRGDSSSPSKSTDSNDISIPKSQEENPLVQLVNQTAANFGMTFNASMWSTYPNPFEDYNEQMKGVSELLLVDGSLGGENNPIRPLIVPDRGIDFIIIYEASSEGKFAWVNGTSLNYTARSASEGNFPFPKIPTVETMITQNFTSQPTFFGCNATLDTPMVLYMPNSPWTAYSNYSYMQGSFTDRQLNNTLENAFQLATYGAGTIDAEWPACLACAAVKRSMARVQMDLPDQCNQCFERHCWNGEESKDRIAAADLDLQPRLAPNLTFSEWNNTVWEAKQTSANGGSEGSAGNKSNGDKEDGAPVYFAGSAAALVCVLTAVLLAV